MLNRGFPDDPDRSTFCVNRCGSFGQCSRQAVPYVQGGKRKLRCRHMKSSTWIVEREISW